MSTAAQIAANRLNAQSSTGPATALGKARAARNSRTSGLYSSGDFVHPGEQDLYAEFCDGFQSELAPEGPVEETLAAEIIHSAWRLRRCSAIENGFVSSLTDDPMVDPILDPFQQSVDRARATALRSFHRATAELRRCQSGRHPDAVPRQKKTQPARPRMQPEAEPSSILSPKMEITKRSQSGTARNAPCTCGSGIKFKRCCGNGAPAVLNLAA